MAAVARLSRLDALPALLLAIGAFRHYGWALAPADQRGVASKLLGAAATLSLLWLVRKAYAGRLVSMVALWWAWEELQTVICSAWYLAAPWPVLQGQAICSAKAGIDIGALGIMIVALLAARIGEGQANGR